MTAFLLPTSLQILSVVIPQICAYRTISHFYFAPFGGDVLVGILFFIGFFLIAYQGQEDYGPSVKWDKRISTFAGICAFGIALFPAKGYSCFFDRELIRAYVHTSEVCVGAHCDAKHFIDYELFPRVADLHSISTLGFFLALAYFAFFIFTKSAADGTMTVQKKRRNVIYKSSALTIVAVLVFMGIRKFVITEAQAEYWDAWRLTFFLESTGLFAFGIAWWVKGEGLPMVNDRVGD